MTKLTTRVMTRRSAVGLLGVLGTSAALGGCTGESLPAATSTDNDDDTLNVSDASSADTAEANTTPEPEVDPTPETPTLSSADALIQKMTLEQKVAQLFFVTPEVLTGVSPVTEAGTTTQNCLNAIPVGGIIYFSENIEGDQQTRDMLSNSVAFSKNAGAGIPIFTGVDEEGGTLVARVANSGVFNVTQFPDMATIGASGDTSQAANVGSTIGSYLHDIGFSVDFAPDADVLTNPDNTVIGTRSFSSDASVVSEMVSAEVSAMLSTQTLPCVKHFPGHGDTEGDSHTGEVTATRTKEQMESCEFLPFQAAAQAGCPFVMVGHIQTPNVTTDGLPATLSSQVITDILRNELGFEGVVISDSMRMGAITQYYTQDDAAVRFLSAGGDMILMPDDLETAYNGVLNAVNAGTLTEDRINDSVKRIIEAKQKAGLVAQ